MFNTQHILYMVISGILTAALLVLFSQYVKKGLTKNKILKFFAIITVMIHYSNLWVDYFSNGGSATVENNHILPVYPCHEPVEQSHNQVQGADIAECGHVDVVGGILAAKQERAAVSASG